MRRRAWRGDVIVAMIVMRMLALNSFCFADFPAFELAEEGLEQQATHVECSHRRSNEAHYIQNLTQIRRGLEERDFALQQIIAKWVAQLGGERLVENLVFGEESRRERKADNGQCRHGEGPECDWHELLQTAHIAHVLRLFVVMDTRMHRVDDAARAKEQARLEKRMCEHMEKAGGERAHADAQEHEPKLAHSGIREHLLDVVLHQRNGRCKQRGKGANTSNQRHNAGSEYEYEVQTADQIDARGDHGRCVYERGHWSGAGHGVGKPDIQRHLCAFARGSKQQHQANGAGSGYRNRAA
jgi:hypothetical protein